MDASAACLSAGTSRPEVAEFAEALRLESQIQGSDALRSSKFVLRGVPVKVEELRAGGASSLVWLLCSSSDACLPALQSASRVSEALSLVPIALDACWEVPSWCLKQCMAHVVLAAAGMLEPPILHTEQAGAAVHLNSSFGFFVLFPEKLLSPSALLGGMDCSRRPVLKTRLMSSGQSAAALLGTLKHELFESMVTSASAATACASGIGDDDLMFLAADAAESASRIAHKPQAVIAAEACGLSPSQVHSALEGCIPNILAFLGQHVFTSGAGGTWHVQAVHAAEEELHCGVLGLKGVVDLLVQVSTDATQGPVRVPLELKTGCIPKSMRAAHRAQVALYSLLLASGRAVQHDSGVLDTQSACVQLNTSVDQFCGVLLHLGSTDSGPAFQGDLVPHSWGEIRSLMQLRNQMATAFHPSFPSMTAIGVPARCSSRSVCEMCFEKEGCEQLAAVEGATHPTTEAAQALTAQSTWSSVEEYVAHFWQLMQLEQAACEAQCAKRNGVPVAESWAGSTPLVRDSPLRMVLQSVKSKDNQGFSESFTLVFSVRTSQGFNLKAGEMVMLSAANCPHSTVLRATVINASAESICLETQFDPHLRVSSLGQLQQGQSKALVQWQLHHEAFATGTRIANTALLRLMDSKYASLFQILNGQAAPTFESVPDSAGSHPWLAELNEEQRAAVDLCLSANTLGIIQGMPGAGKSTTTTALCLCLLKQGKRVLLCSHTNGAVDALLRKLAAQADFATFQGIRVGNQSKVQKELHEYCVGMKKAARSVGSACWVAGTAHSVCSMAAAWYDYVIVDEASQLTEPATLALAQLGETLIMVGDHMQIAPLVHSSNARQGGLACSMMQRLASLWPQCLAKLCTQYRMSAELQHLSNVFMYKGEMRCGVAHKLSTACLSLPSPADSHTELERALLQADREVVIVDTPKPHNLSAAQLHDCPKGAAAIVHCCLTFLSNGVSAADIAIICAQRKHVDFFSRCFQMVAPIHVGTIDTFQGQEAPIILLDAFERIPNLLLDARRMNVACTRATAKFMMFCHAADLWLGPIGAAEASAKRWLLPLPDMYTSAPSAVCESIEQGGVPGRSAWPAAALVRDTLTAGGAAESSPAKRSRPD